MTPVEYQRIVETAWGLATKQGLLGLNVERIAEAVSIPLSKIKDLLPEPADAILLLVADVLRKIKITSNPALSEQDRLFDALIQGFDMAEPHKPAIQKLWRDLMWKPLLLWQIVPSFQKKIDEIAQSLTENDGYLGKSLTGLGIRAIFFNTYLTWIDDETLDLSKTMATLDQSLKQYYEMKSYII